MTDQLIKVAIAEDHKIFRDGIKRALKTGNFSEYDV
jgi:DNA-binding NarL/FixJ family response regulator